MSTEQKDKIFLSRLLSGLAALFGIQSEENRERDFKEGKPGEFIAVGIFLVIAFIAVLYFVVSAVVKDAGLN